ncbi:hypothetical protein CCAL9344_05465 [Campylobacter sp. RM9344]|uniref:Uncharacterized protein n=1 Tax=Campylobacter californiensis TaxID=1032243 RepID=A0AAW3ZU32_9BACT|nr:MULTISPECIES: hypothetical protein [unclassified Campylobacter]MBE2984773.1 hypothetical protein [Campylobacter sp. RM6883]MBE2986477.1 hypothetical protein [Campylobacter sp. RM12919]MBE2987677.1 hypothetical protein [Campylobacter sp. RM12920]MBE2994761.1 hypothetical protein [Campylobacter sp. RM6913]MBE3022325.1 hypothetical protein [Campylobacter sp. 7477a]MBE3029627.1 hypothetical protein [Campylobacter sp. RM9344]
MNGLTQKERMELESVFSAICTKKEGKFIRFYREFYSLTFNKITQIKLKVKNVRMLKKF